MPTYTDDEIRRMNRIEAAIVAAILIGTIVFLWWWNETRPMREQKAYEDGARAAEQKAASVGGWDRWVEMEVAKVGKEAR